MSHPKNRAERRNIRRQVLYRNIELAYHMMWFSKSCYCEPKWRYLDPNKRWPCWIHRNRAFWQQAGQYVKTGPSTNKDKDWFMQGVLRRDYRAGGGRRASSHQVDWGGGMHGAGRFSLDTALREYENIGSEPTPDQYLKSICCS